MKHEWTEPINPFETIETMKRLEHEENKGDAFNINRDISCNINIRDLAYFLNKSIKNDATHIYFSADVYDGCCDEIDLYPIAITLESKKDYQKRLDQEQERLDESDKLKKERRKQQYLSLKKEFED